MVTIGSTRVPSTAGIQLDTLLLAATVAGVLPALRATRVDPREALRAD